MEIEVSRDFKGIWIPRELWLDQTLTPLQKMLIVEIDSLSRGGACSASNEYLAKFFGVTVGRMAHMITDLRKLGWIETVSFDGRSRKLALSKSIKAEVVCVVGKRQGCVDETRHLLYRENKEENKEGVFSSSKTGGEASLFEEDDKPKVSLATPSKMTDEYCAELIYAQYPFKVGRPDALKAIVKALKKETFDTLLSKTKEFARIRGDNKEYCPYPATWFNQERYNDDPATWAPAKAKPPFGEVVKPKVELGPSQAELMAARRKNKQ